MDNLITSIKIDSTTYQANQLLAKQRIIPQPVATSDETDTVEFGQGASVTSKDAQDVIYERAIAKLKAVVAEAKETLGLPEGAPLDLSNEATANRIADFALSAFDSWRSGHQDFSDGDAATQFSEFIQTAIGKGIDEAKGILKALNALTPEVESNISTISELISARMNDFVSGMAEQA